MFTPADVHHGRIEELLTARQAVMDAAFEAHPERFVRGRPVVAAPRDTVWINPPRVTSEAPALPAPGATEVQP